MTVESLSSASAPVRGKFRSLTLINWNGFFARTFDLDEMVTTLSGGNGAGKSTTMAGFVTALIPDLTLLNFRNTTEAGATSGSRDRGLYGKLKPGVCYALLESENSRGQRVIAGVRLQQVAGRDRKVDIRAFTVLDLPAACSVIGLVTEQIGEKARVLALTDVKTRLDGNEALFAGAGFKQYQSIGDYHSTLFELGLLPKRLRSSAERAKFHKLIEASLYGGISGAITKSLREYLLPENSSVQQAFHDMESALRENRMTLEAIKVTQADRDMFKKLITESTDYVSADYMRHANARRGNVEAALSQRQAWQGAKQQLENEQHRFVELSRELQQLTESEQALEQEAQHANDRLALITRAVSEQAKIDRYQEDVAILHEQVEEQQMALDEAEGEYESAQATLEANEERVDDLRAQLADFQQALDAQQTRALQYQQAIAALEKARQICQIAQLDEHNAADYLDEFESQLDEATEAYLALEQKNAMSDLARTQFDKAYQLICQLEGELPRHSAWEAAKARLSQFPQQQLLAQQAGTLRQKHHELTQRLAQQENVARWLTEFNQHARTQLTDAAALEEYAETYAEQLAEVSELLEESVNQRAVLRQQREQLQTQITQLSQSAPAWHTAQSALNRLVEQCGSAFERSQDVTHFMQETLSRERQFTLARDNFARELNTLEQQISSLSQPDGADDARLNQLAERFGGVLLSELYEEVSIEDAPYFSALYGPSRHAIVVRDLSAIEAQLADIEDCPDDLYFIEGDPNAFDEGALEGKEIGRGVLVQVSDRQVRFSRFPTVPLFGRASRELRLEELKARYEAVSDEHAQAAFEVQKCQRLYQHLSQFVGTHLTLAFQPSPEEAIQQCQAQRAELDREFNQSQAQEAQLRQQLEALKAQEQRLHKILPQVALLSDESLSDRLEQCLAQLEEAEEAEQLVRHDGHLLAQLEPIAGALQSDPEQFAELERALRESELQRASLQQRVYSLQNVVQRMPHFSYQESAQVESSELNENLRKHLAQAQQEREQAKIALREAQQRFNEYNQVFTSLRSSLGAKEQMLRELLAEINELGVRGDVHSEAAARAQRDELAQQLHHQRQRRQYIDKQLTLIESENSALIAQLRKAEREYKLLRTTVVESKVSWGMVQTLSRNSDVEKRLNRGELAYKSADELRSISDKALGALRIAVADNEYLRDSLRASEDSQKPEKKVAFFIEVYRHLRERIRQDIIKTDDPIDAIEQMEIELSRLTEELNSREKRLALSAGSVANILRKTIQREENRIRQLNQGLQNIAFGQVKGVRLVVNIRDTHAILLNALSGDKAEYDDLFNDKKLSFSEALAMLYKRLNPHLDTGQRSAQVLGEELLDYRNYLALDVETFRGTDGWMRAESSALSTGEAIGTGMSILLMVVQSWEDESRRLRSKDILPCRLLFLDEAARLDAKSILTLFELCERLDMQLLIAAPENISPEQGTTYKLVRKISQNQEYVQVVGLKGFGQNAPALEHAPTAS